MPVTIPDSVLAQSGLTEREFLVEVACRLYSGDVLDQPAAIRLCGLTRVEFWDELSRRGLPWMRSDYSIEEDLRALGSTGPAR